MNTTPSRALDLNRILNDILLHLAEVVPYDSACVFLLEDQQVRVVAGRGLPAPAEVIGQCYPLDPESLFYELHRTRRPLHLIDAQTDPRLKQWGIADLAQGWLGVPLMTGGDVIGYLTLVSRQAAAYSPAQAQLVQIFANQAATTVENVRLYEAERAARRQAEILREEAKQNLAEITRLYELSTEVVSALTVAEVANLVIEKVVEATSAHSAVLNLLDENGEFEQSFGPQEPPPRPTGTTMSICLTGQPLVIYDTQYEPRGISSHLIKKGIRASIGLPLKAGKQVIGVLFVRHSKPHRFSRREIETLFIFANQAAIAIQNARLYEQVHQYTAELEDYVAEQTFELQVLYELAQALGRATQLGDVIRLVLLHLYRAIPYDVAASLLISDEMNTNLVIQSQSLVVPQLEAQIQEIMYSTLASFGQQAVSQTTIEVHRLHPKEMVTGRSPLETLGSLIQVPIFVDETPVGLLLIGAEQPGQFGAEQARLLRTAADQAAESIRRLQSLLAAEHRRLESLVAHLPIGLILLDPEQHIILANPRAQEFLAKTSHSVIGDQLTQFGDHPLETILTSESAKTAFEVKVAGPPNHLFELTAKPMVVGSEAGSWLLMIRDITAERVAQKQIQQQERMAAVGQLAAGIAHDFNNILTSIIGYADMLQREPDLPQLAKEDLKRITNQGRRAAHLVRQILDFSRQSITQKRALDLVPFIKETIKLLERTIPENIYITLEIAPTPKPYLFNADLTQMQQAITNLAVNARDVMPAGGALQFRLAHFKLAAGQVPPCPDMEPGHWIALAVQDTGTGILPEHRPHIFEPFFTTKPAGKGTGLGLAQVYGIVSEHGGYIEVDSELNKGTTFTLYFPSLVAVTQNSGQSTATDPPQGHGEVILVVEDNLTVLETSRAMLQYLGYTVLTASNGRHALEVFERHRAEIGLVLTDITMPDMGGLALSRTLQGQKPGLRVVALTGYPLDTDRETKAWRADGIVDWVQKPLSLDDLAQTVNRWLK
ncbi:MAG: GAF domain-containing protein [Chloroflexota bacterium]